MGLFAMLEESDSIDMISQDKSGVVWFTIVDAGITTEPEERYQCLIEKLRTYLGFIMSPDFATQHPGVQRSAVKIRVMSRTQPTPKMAEIRQIRSRTTPPFEIPVLFELSPSSDARSPAFVQDDVRSGSEREGANVQAMPSRYPRPEGAMNPHDFRFAMTGAIVISVVCSIYLVASIVLENASTVQKSKPAPKSSPEPQPAPAR